MSSSNQESCDEKTRPLPMVPWNVQETPEPAASGHCSSVSDTSRGKYILSSHSHISRFSSSSPIFSADAINLLCIPNLQVVFSSAELRAPPSLWFPELAGSWSQTLQLAWNSRDQSRGSEFGTIVKLGPGGGGAALCLAAAAGLRIPHSLGCLR